MRIKALVLAVGCAALLSGCGAGAKTQAAELTGGDPERGASAIVRYGCGSCHTIAGITGAHGLVGPPLTGVGSRMYIGGSLANEPENLKHWIRDPHAVNSKTAMPNLGVTAADATDIAAYLYCLR